MLPTNFSVLPSMQILANSSRDVEILAPLRCTSPLSTFEWAVNIGTSSPLTDNALIVDASARIEGALTVIGNLTVGGTLTCQSIKPWIGLLVNASGVITANVGQVPNSEIAVSLASSIFTITFATSPHPLGSLGFLSFAQATGSTVFSATTTSSNGIFSTGEKKCIPITRDASAPTAAAK